MTNNTNTLQENPTTSDADHIKKYNSATFTQYTHEKLTKLKDYSGDLLILPDTKSYLPIPNCLLGYITTNSKLSDADKLIFLHKYAISFFERRNNKERTIASSLQRTADKLNISKAQVISSQKKLEHRGLFTIKRQKNGYNQNKPNLITPLIPDDLFTSLNKSNNRIGVDDSFNKQESNLDHLERTKQFINFNYGILKFILEHDDLASSCKILAIDLFTMWYKYHLSSNNNSDFRFLVNYKQLNSRHDCSLKSTASKLMKLEEQGIIFKKQIFAKNGEERNARHDKSIWEIVFNFPKWYKDMQAPNQLHTDTLYNKTIEDELFKSDEQGREFYSTHSEEVNNLESILHNNSGAIDELIDKLSEFKKSFKQNITSCSNSSDNFHNKNGQKTGSNSSLENDFTDNLDIASNTDESAVCYKNDPGTSKNIPHNNRDILIKIFKSNLRNSAKVIFNKFLDKIGLGSNSTRQDNSKNNKDFSITKELVRRKLKNIPQDKADKARKYAYSLFSKKIPTGYAATLDKHELTKQFIIHVATWKPSKLGKLARTQEIDAALSFAWKSIANGTWQAPLEYAKAKILDYELQSYRDKYSHLGVLSPELKTLEIETDKLFSGYSNLTTRIQEEASYGQLDHYKAEKVNPFDNGIGHDNDAIIPQLDIYPAESSSNATKLNPLSKLNTLKTLEQGILDEKIIENNASTDYAICHMTSIPSMPKAALDAGESSCTNGFNKYYSLGGVEGEGNVDNIDKLAITAMGDLPLLVEDEPLSYFGKLERVVVEDNGDIHVLFDADSSSRFKLLQTQHKYLDQIQDESIISILEKSNKLISNISDKDIISKQATELVNIKHDCVNMNENNIGQSNKMANFTEMDISHLNEENRLYRIYGADTDKLALEGINNKTSFTLLKEMGLRDDGKLEVVFG